MSNSHPNMALKMSVGTKIHPLVGNELELMPASKV